MMVGDFKVGKGEVSIRKILREEWAPRSRFGRRWGP